MEKILIITGKGNISVKPDIIIISFEVNSHEMEYESTIENLNRKVDELRDVVEKNGLDRKKLKTKNFSIHRDTIWNKKREIYDFNGFVARHNLDLQLSIDVELINAILVQISRRMEDVEFKISFGTKNQKKYKKELIKDAIKEAREMADLITTQAEVKLKEILKIDYSFSELHLFSEPMTFALSDCSESLSTAGPDIEPEEFKLSENITITWEIA